MRSTGRLDDYCIAENWLRGSFSAPKRGGGFEGESNCIVVTNDEGKNDRRISRNDMREGFPWRLCEILQVFLSMYLEMELRYPNP